MATGSNHMIQGLVCSQEFVLCLVTPSLSDIPMCVFSALCTLHQGQLLEQFCCSLYVCYQNGVLMGCQVQVCVEQGLNLDLPHRQSIRATRSSVRKAKSKIRKPFSLETKCVMLDLGSNKCRPSKAKGLCHTGLLVTRTCTMTSWQGSRISEEPFYVGQRLIEARRATKMRCIPRQIKLGNTLSILRLYSEALGP